jgi:dTDP-4-dehydrorhamnose reductase
VRVLVFGHKGQLGRDLMLVLGREHEVKGVDIDEVDIRNSAAVEGVVRGSKPDLLINAAAYTNVEQAEDDGETAAAINVDGARHCAAASGKAGAPIVYYSTDYVFDGQKRTPYEPDDLIAPAGVYARTKADGEEATRNGNAKHFIIRTAWLYGPGGNNFVEKIITAAKTRPSLRVVTDEAGSPTHTWDLAEATLALVKTAAYGTYHAVNAGSCSRYEFARAILELAGLETPVEPCLSSEFPAKARRPLYSVLSNAKLEAACGRVMRPWRAALEHYLQRRAKQA